MPFTQDRVWKVVASAGTGKSYSIEKCIFELIDSGVKPMEIMYLIYNKVPGHEFKQRMVSRGIDEKELRWVGTHHSVCMKMLGLGKKSLLNIKEWGEARNMDFDEEKKGWSEVLKSLEQKINAEQTDYDPHEAKLLTLLQNEESINKQWTHVRYRAHALAMERIPPEVKYVFVDEAQDSVLIQWKYFEFLRGLEQIQGLMLAGDDKQAVNGWTGGRGDMFLKFQADRQVCLGKTYRNAPAILRAANNIAMQIQERSPLTTESAQPFEGEVSEIPYFQNCVPDILDALKNKKSIMVLCRAGFVANGCKDLLVQNGVPVASDGRTGVLATLKALDVAANKPLQNLTFMDIFNIFSSKKLKTKGYWDNYAKFERGEFEDTARAEYALMCADMPWSGDLSMFGAKPRLEEDLAAMREGRIPTEGWSAASEETVLDAFRSMKTYGPDMIPVRVSTIHKIKGAECDVVVLVKNISGAIRQTERDDPDEECKIWYTGATRAREKLIITELFADYLQVTRLV